VREAQDALTRALAAHRARALFLHHLAFRLRRCVGTACGGVVEAGGRASTYVAAAFQPCASVPAGSNLAEVDTESALSASFVFNTNKAPVIVQCTARRAVPRRSRPAAV